MAENWTWDFSIPRPLPCHSTTVPQPTRFSSREKSACLWHNTPPFPLNSRTVVASGGNQTKWHGWHCSKSGCLRQLLLSCRALLTSHLWHQHVDYMYRWQQLYMAASCTWQSKQHIFLRYISLYRRDLWNKGKHLQARSLLCVTDAKGLSRATFAFKNAPTVKELKQSDAGRPCRYLRETVDTGSNPV